MDRHIFGIMFVDFSGYFVQSATFYAQVGCSPDAAGIEKIPSPMEKVARPSASEELAGRKRNAGGNLKVKNT